jgi:hypothetical protein
VRWSNGILLYFLCHQDDNIGADGWDRREFISHVGKFEAILPVTVMDGKRADCANWSSES